MEIIARWMEQLRWCLYDSKLKLRGGKEQRGTNQVKPTSIILILIEYRRSRSIYYKSGSGICPMRKIIVVVVISTVLVGAAIGIYFSVNNNASGSNRVNENAKENENENGTPNSDSSTVSVLPTSYPSKVTGTSESPSPSVILGTGTIADSSASPSRPTATADPSQSQYPSSQSSSYYYEYPSQPPTSTSTGTSTSTAAPTSVEPVSTTTFTSSPSTGASTSTSPSSQPTTVADSSQFPTSTSTTITTVNNVGPVGCIKTPIESKVDTPQEENYDSIVLISNVVYGKGAVTNGEKDLKLDIYHPSLNDNDNANANTNKKYPLMIHIHGGGFHSGSKNDGYITNLSYYWASKGYVVATINYRLMGDAPIVSDRMRPMFEYSLLHLSQVLKSRLQCEAATCAVEDTLVANEFMAGLDYVDGTTVVINGYSAGAITSLWAAYGVDNFGISVSDDPSPVIKAVISHWGLLLVDQTQTNEFVSANDPPVFMIHATGDKTVPYDGTQYLSNRMEVLGLDYALHCENSAAHAISIDSTVHNTNGTNGNSMSILEAERIWLWNVLHGS